MNGKLLNLLMLVALLFSAVPQASADDRFYAGDFNMEPGTSRTVGFILDNDREFIGFQADIVLPEGLEVVMDGQSPQCSLSTRTDGTYSLFSNVLADGTVRVGAFSVQNTPIQGNSGELLNISFATSDTFAGGVLHIKNIRFVGTDNQDVLLPDVDANVSTQYVNSFYITDFNIAVGETKTVSMLLDNEQEFTAFQSDIYLPEGLSIVPNSFALTSRAASHTISSRDFGDGRVRIACFSTGNMNISGNSGALVTFEVTADKDVAETAVVELKNTIFTTGTSREVRLPNTSCNVSTERALVESLVLSQTELRLPEGQTAPLSVTVLPEYASTKDVEWKSSNEEVATVSSTGEVTALKAGTATITCSAVDGSGVTATCAVTVTQVLVSSISVAPSQVALRTTETAQLVATVSPENASNKELSWVSSDETVATVDATGKVTAVKEGDAVITVLAMDGSGVTSEVKVSVVPTLAERVVLNLTSLSLKVAGTATLSAIVTPETTTNKSVTWSSSNEAVATVSPEGLVTAVSLGEATITATAADGSGVTATCIVTVGATQAEGVSITAEGATTLKAGGTVQLRATVTPETATDKSVTWSSSDNNIATVNAEGLVTAVGVGTAAITCTNSAGQTATLNITVEATPVSSITLNRTTAALKVSGTLQLEATVSPETATDKTVTWSSSNENIATVNTEGIVTAISIGEATITATAADGSGVTATCIVAVEPTLVSSITLSATSATLNKGENLTLTAAITPSDATDKSITWASSDVTVTTVNENGEVTAVGPGTATITATAADGSGVSATCAVTVHEQVTISWEQDFEVVVGDVVQLEAEASNGAQVSFRAVQPNGGYVSPQLVNDNGVWTATFANTGAVVLEAYIDDLGETTECEPVRKTFNVLPDRDVLLIDGIYYRYTDDTHTALYVTYGYKQYEDDVVVPPVAGGLPVVSVGNHAFYSNAGLTSVTLPEGLERIEDDQAFGNCPSLANVTLPFTLTYIGGWTFNSDSGLLEIHCGMEHPSDVEIYISSSGEDIFNGFVDYDNCVLYVPIGSADEYREAEVWKNFKNIVEEQGSPVLVALLSFDADDIRLNAGETAVINASVYPSSADNQTLDWTSNDETVATVDAYGEVTAVGVGSAVITATTTDGSELSASCAVTVEMPSGIEAVGCEGVRISTTNGRIVVSGLADGDGLTVTSLGGGLVYKGADKAVNVPVPGVYIVGIKGHYYKVAVR